MRENAPKDEVLALLHKHRIEKVLVVDSNFNLKGMITVKDFQKATEFPHAAKDDRGALQSYVKNAASVYVERAAHLRRVELPLVRWRQVGRSAEKKGGASRPRLLRSDRSPFRGRRCSPPAGLSGPA